MRKKSDRGHGGVNLSTLRRWKRESVNFLGILLAFVIAFGGIFVVRGRLIADKDLLFGGCGMIEIPVQAETEALSTGEIKIEKVQLTGEEIWRAVRDVERKNEGYAYPHEPFWGQLSMTQALEYGREWLEDFFLPCLAAEKISKEYKTSCHLWALEQEDGTDADSGLFSYWTVTLENQDVAASLTLNAVTGQVLDASVNCYFPIEYSERGVLMSLLKDYTDSFGVEVQYSSLLEIAADIYEDTWGMYQVLQDGEVFAILQTKDYVLNSVKDNIVLCQNIFCVHLYLATGIDYE